MEDVKTLAGRRWFNPHYCSVSNILSYYNEEDSLTFFYDAENLTLLHAFKGYPTTDTRTGTTLLSQSSADLKRTTERICQPAANFKVSKLPYVIGYHRIDFVSGNKIMVEGNEHLQLYDWKQQRVVQDFVAGYNGQWSVGYMVSDNGDLMLVGAVRRAQSDSISKMLKDQRPGGGAVVIGYHQADSTFIINLRDGRIVKRYHASYRPLPGGVIMISGDSRSYLYRSDSLSLVREYSNRFVGPTADLRHWRFDNKGKEYKIPAISFEH